MMRTFFDKRQSGRALLFLAMLAVLVQTALVLTAFSAQASSTEKSTTLNESGMNQTGMKNVTIALVAEDMAFNTSTITVPAGSHVTVNFENRDKGVRHNFAVYDSSMNEIFRGSLISGPKKTDYTFDAPEEPGTYRFQCDPHASFMNGQLIVQ